MGSHDDVESVNIRTIALPDLEVSRAGTSPRGPGYWSGSDDGPLQFISLVDAESIGP